TYAAKFTLRIAELQARHKLVEQATQRQQIGCTKVRPAISNPPELIHRVDIGPRGGDREKSIVFADVNDSVLAPVNVSTDRVDLLPTQLDFGQFIRRGRAHSPCAPRCGAEF